MLKSLLNDFYVVESGYFDNLYHVTSHELTDGRLNTGGWGSQTAKRGNFIQATYFRPVYVTSVTVAGGFIPSWGHDTTEEHGFMDLEYSVDGRTWEKVNYNINKIFNPHFVLKNAIYVHCFLDFQTENSV